MTKLLGPGKKVPDKPVAFVSQVPPHPGVTKSVKHIPKKALIAGIFVLCALAVIGGISVWRHSSAKQKRAPTVISESEITPEDPKVVAKRVDQSTHDGNLRDQAVQLIHAGNPNKAAEIYATAIQAELTPERKIQLYLDLSEVYFDAGLNDKAIQTAQTADGLSEDKFLVSDWLSRVYEALGNYKQAVVYYRQAAKWASSTQNNTGITKEMYQQEADRVQGLAS